MEIDLDQFYEGQSPVVINNRKEAILKNLEQERQARRACIAQGRKFKIENYDTPSSFLQLTNEDRPLQQVSPRNVKMVSKISSFSSEFTRPPDTRQEFMHNQLKEPDFEQLSHIYENYLRSPKVLVENTQPKTTVKKNPNPTRNFYGPTGYGLKKGEGYFQNIMVILNQEER